MEKWIVIFFLFGAIPLYLQQEKICNEAICAPIVSKCMLTQACKCNMKKNVTCKRECFQCLDYLFLECCGCVDVCPKSNVSDSELGKKSHVEDFPQSEPALFLALTEEKDRLLRWTSFTFLSRVTVITAVHNEEVQLSTVSTDMHGSPTEEILNCTVAFLSDCIPFGKCRDSCLSMGASSCRWFHNGCCECVGSTCLNYGMNEGRCLNCPKEIDEDDEDSAIVYNEDTEDLQEINKEKSKPVEKEEEEEEGKKGETKEETLQKIDS